MGKRTYVSDPGDKTGRRFTGKLKRDPATVWALPDGHAVITEQRTMFPSTVVSALDSQRLLISGANSIKLGAKVKRGDWAGFPIYQLSLEERAACPPTCNNRNTCYGNSMPFARRHKVDEHLLPALETELAVLQSTYPRGFVVRLHVLGDFFGMEYLQAWFRFLDQFQALHIFGYTAWPRDSEIGAAIAWQTRIMWKRFAIRFSSATSEPQGATTVWHTPKANVYQDNIVCPAQTEATACCATCGLCWAASAKDKTIVFIGHGPTYAQKKAVA